LLWSLHSTQQEHPLLSRACWISLKLLHQKTLACFSAQEYTTERLRAISYGIASLCALIVRYQLHKSWIIQPDI